MPQFVHTMTPAEEEAWVEKAQAGRLPISSPARVREEKLLALLQRGGLWSVAELNSCFSTHIQAISDALWALHAEGLVEYTHDPKHPRGSVHYWRVKRLNSNEPGAQDKPEAALYRQPRE